MVTAAVNVEDRLVREKLMEEEDMDGDGWWWR
jgi:hypothetical protein